MSLMDDLIVSLPDGKVIDVRIGLNWTAVVAEVGGERRCGLASTLVPTHDHTVHPEVPPAGKLDTKSPLELAAYIDAKKVTLRSVGMAAINALLPRNPEDWQEINAEDVIARHGENKKVALIGSFPFVKRLKERVGELVVLEQTPVEGELHAHAAPQVLPDADVVAITGLSLINHTFEDLFNLCSKNAIVLVLGPSTPLSQVMFDYGVHLLSGAVVDEIDPVLKMIVQGGYFRQVKQAGVRLVTVTCPGL